LKCKHEANKWTFLTYQNYVDLGFTTKERKLVLNSGNSDNWKIKSTNHYSKFVSQKLKIEKVKIILQLWKFAE